MFAAAEVVDIEEERGLIAIAYGHLNEVANLLVDRLYILQWRELRIEMFYNLTIIIRRYQQQCITTLPISARATSLLIVTLQRIAHRIVHNETNVSLVDTHTESIGSHHYTHLALGPLLLANRALGVG